MKKHLDNLLYLPDIVRESVSQFECIAPSLHEIQQSEEIVFMDEGYKRPRFEEVTIIKIENHANFFGEKEPSLNVPDAIDQQVEIQVDTNAQELVAEDHAEEK